MRQRGVLLACGLQPVNFRENSGLDMRRRQDAAVGAVAQRLLILRVLAGQHGEVLRTPAQQFAGLVAVRAAILEADDVGVGGQAQHRLVAEIDAGAVGNVVQRYWMRGAIGERAEVKLKSLLRRPRIIRAGNQIEAVSYTHLTLPT